MSRPPEYPSSSSDPQGGDPANPAGYPPPPPPPGYGPPPPRYGGPPPPAGYAPPRGFGGGPTQHFSVGDAFKWAWNKFSKNAGALIVPMLLYGLVIGIVGGVIAALWVSHTNTSTVGDNGYSETQTSTAFGAGAITALILCYLILIAVGIYMQAAFLSGCLDIADGKQVGIGSFFRPRNFGPVILAALMVGVLTAIGNLLCLIPGLIFGFFAMFTIAFVIDRSLSPVDALKASIATVRSNIGGALLSFLVQLAVVLVGELLCGVGVIVAVPLAVLIQTYTYRRLSGGQLVPLS